MTSIEQSDETFMQWMRHNLRHAAGHFGLTLTSEPVFGWRLRSLSASARTRANQACWLRVCSEHSRWVREMPELWTGNADANVIDGVPKPRVLDTLEWEVREEDRFVRAELMTLVSGLPCSPTEVLRGPPNLPDPWWSQLRVALARLANVNTSRFMAPVGQREGRVRQVFGDRVADAMRPQRWETAHGDLHWANVLGPDLVIIDWELWGRAPAGTDAATLYLFSLPAPETAAQVHDVFADVLGSRHGRIALVGVAARILYRARLGDFPDLADAVQDHVGELLRHHR